MVSENENSYMKNKKDYVKNGCIENYRLRLVQSALSCGISETARKFFTTRKTVKKWIDEYDEAKSNDSNDKLNALKNKSRRGQYHPKKISAKIREEIVKYRKATGFGAYFIKNNLELPYSERAIHNILVQECLVEKPKTKTQKRQDMTATREATPVFEKIQEDIKYLDDIPNLFPLVLYKQLPKYMITARDYKSGDTFISFSYTKDSTVPTIFTAYLIDHLIDAEVDLSNTHFQTDQGSEFRSPSKIHGLSGYEQVLTNRGVIYRFNPRASPTWNGDVESFHWRIEVEFFNVEKFTSEKDFLTKAWIYMMWYNRLRPNRNKGKKSPLEILKENGYKNLDKLTTLPPIITDHYVKDIELIKKGGYFKCASPTSLLPFVIRKKSGCYLSLSDNVS